MKKILLTTAAVIMSASFASANTNAGTTHLILIDESVGGTFISYQSDVISESDTYSWNGTEYANFFAASIAATTDYNNSNYDQNDIGILADGTNVENAVAEAYKNIIAANAQIATLQATITGLESDISAAQNEYEELFDSIDVLEIAKEAAEEAKVEAEAELAEANTALTAANLAVELKTAQIVANNNAIEVLQAQLDGEVDLGKAADAKIEQLNIDVTNANIALLAAVSAQSAAEAALLDAQAAQATAEAAQATAETKYNTLYSEVNNTEDGLNVQIGELKAQIAVLEESDNAAVAAKVQEIVGLKATITELNAEIVAHEATIAAFDVTSNDAAVIAAAVDAAEAPLNTKIAELEADITANETAIASLTTSKNLATEAKLAAELALNIANNKILTLETAEEAQGEAIAALELEVTDLTAEIAVLELSEDYLGTLLGNANKLVKTLQTNLAEAQAAFAASEVASNAKDNSIKYLEDTLAFYVDGIQEALDTPAAAPSKDTPAISAVPSNSLFDAVTSFQYQQSATEHRIRLKAGEAGFTEYVTTDLDDTQTLILSLTESVFDKGFEGGYEAGYNDGWQDGYTVGFADGWSSAIDSLLPTE